ncbi:Lipopolysaccharide kinase [Trichophyton interdigitale]|nr:Lipopolysaccharide kinase [Trichophyton interdigitale]KAG5216999.1 Lipopolysaccharide kinase [Trichophyton interdigitale]KAG8205495.1 Lipopolysaccharide kinase [Trichophyton interdigitale]
MASDDTLDYKALFLQAEERRLQAEERLQQAEEARQQAEEERQQAEEERQRAEERTQPTSFEEFIQTCHNLLSLPIKVRDAARSTRGSIPKPAGKLCPTYLRPWSSPFILDELYRRVNHHFQPTDKLFPSLAELEAVARRCSRPLGSEKDLEFYAHIAVEQHVQDVIMELCNKPQARDRFALGEAVVFENHANAIDEDDDTVDDGNYTLLTTVEYKPPHKLSVENLAAGLRPMNLWEEVVQLDTIPTEENAKLLYNAEQMTASTLVQEFHVMINEGLEFSYITNGLAYVLLRVYDNDPTTLYYYFCNPNKEVDSDALSRTAIARVLCLCLMSCRSPVRNQDWRNNARQQLHVWETNLDYERGRIPDDELNKTPPSSEHAPSSPYVPSSPLSSPTADNYRPVTRSQAGCAPQSTDAHPSESTDSDSDSPQVAARRKRNLSQLTASPPGQQRSRQIENRGSQSQGSYREEPHVELFCTQKCLLGLKRGDNLDITCPNVERHRSVAGGDKHPITTEQLVGLIKQQLDTTLNRDCSPFGSSGSYGAPFKVTCRRYGYTVVGKGTTSYRWSEVSSEATIYRILRELQGSAVPVFLGLIDLQMIYYLHGVGAIQHMLLMGWGGEHTSGHKPTKELLRQIRRSEKEIRALGVHHGDFRRENILWNEELRRALIIDFHRCKLVRPDRKKRSVDGNGLLESKNKKKKAISCGTPTAGNVPNAV